MADSRPEGIKVNSYELGWRYTGDSLRTQLAAYYSTSDKSIVINRSDMTINVQPDDRRIYGLEGAVDYFIADTDWSLGGNFNVIKSEVKQNGNGRNGMSLWPLRPKQPHGSAGRLNRGHYAYRASKHLI